MPRRESFESSNRSFHPLDATIDNPLYNQGAVTPSTEEVRSELKDIVSSEEEK